MAVYWTEDDRRKSWTGIMEGAPRASVVPLCLHSLEPLASRYQSLSYRLGSWKRIRRKDVVERKLNLDQQVPVSQHGFFIHSQATRRRR